MVSLFHCENALKNTSGVRPNCRGTKDGHHYYQVMQKTEHMWQTFRRGDYLSRDTLHHEIEWLRDAETHKGAIDVLTGKVKPGSARADRKLKIK